MFYKRSKHKIDFNNFGIICLVITEVLLNRKLNCGFTAKSLNGYHRISKSSL